MFYILYTDALSYEVSVCSMSSVHGRLHLITNKAIIFLLHNYEPYMYFFINVNVVQFR